MGVEPFNRRVKLAARAFYDERGIAVVVLDALMRTSMLKFIMMLCKRNSKKLKKLLRNNRNFQTHPFLMLFLAPVAGNISETYKVNDLNVEAEDSEEDEDDIGFGR
ncbi:hypothetical protein LWI28_015313 [Acer negundo]|uniref:Uncharacterized protein n=1 Tax=Acer negundo TaxID=4023 RepID=A0AAD5IW56_ACENE|nr:hypothetical protein LWI28_015313 [Acer negundo]KAK4844980.1 hypothetical protein QYF36_026716 [Acer negundo]